MFMYNTKRKYLYIVLKNPRFLFRDYQSMLAYQALNTRYYAGRMVQCEFVNIPSWSAAICGKQFLMIYVNIFDKIRFI